jgi:hypothetical protein
VSRCKLLLLAIGRLRSRMSKLNRAWLIWAARFIVQSWLALMTTAARVASKVSRSSEQSWLQFGKRFAHELS